MNSRSSPSSPSRSAPPAESLSPAMQAVGLTTTTVMWLAATLSMLQPLATDLYLPTLPGIAAYFGASVATVQWTLSIFVGTFGVWQLVAGPLSDRFGRHPIIVAGVSTYCAASLLCMLAPTIEVLIAGRLLQAIGACSCVVGARGVVRDLMTPTAGAGLVAAAATIMGLAPLLGPVLGAHMFVAFGWRSAFALQMGCSLGLLVFVLLRLRETNTGMRRNPRALEPLPMLRAYFEVLRSPTFRAYTLSATASYGGLFAFISGSSFVLIRIYGLSTIAFGFAFAFMVSGFMLGTLICRRLVAVRGLQQTVYAGAALQATAGVVMAGLALAQAHVAAAIIVPMFFYGVSHGIVQPPAQSGAVAPFAHTAGTAAALLGFIMMLVAAIIGFWIGASYDGTPYPLTLTIGISSLISAAIAFALVHRHGDISQYR